MSRRKKKKVYKSNPNYKEPPKRKFFVNGEFEFELFYDPDEKDEDVIMEKFQQDKDWKWFIDLYKVKYKSASFSEDQKEVYIVTSPKHK